MEEAHAAQDTSPLSLRTLTGVYLTFPLCFSLGILRSVLLSLGIMVRTRASSTRKDNDNAGSVVSLSDQELSSQG